METHPDRVVLLGERALQQSTRAFLSVQTAYQQLQNFLQGRDIRKSFGPHPDFYSQNNGFCNPSHQTQTKRHRRKNGHQPFHKANGSRAFSSSPPFNHRPAKPVSQEEGTNLYHGPIPNRPLLFGHFLYYSGLIEWRTIIKALLWQRNQRPRLGELGVSQGWLNKNAIERILRNRQGLALFGQAAVDMALLTQRQLDALVERQKLMQRRFGNFFIDQKIFSSSMLNELLIEHQRHNRRQAESRLKNRSAA